MIKKIAVIGATGVLGKPVTIELVNAGFSVTALVRNLSKAKSMLPNEVNLVEGDLTQMSDIITALTAQEAVYLSLNLNTSFRKDDFHPEIEGLQNILSATYQTHVKRIALLSSLVMHYQGIEGFDWWAFTIKHNAVKMIRESGIPYTIFYPSTFFENFTDHYRQGSKIILAGKSLFPQWFIGAEDYGRQVARSFQILTNENKEYPIQGLESFTTDKAAKEYVSHHTKEKLSITNAPLWLVRFFGLFSNKANYGAHIIEALNNYPEKFESEKTWQELGKPTLTLKEFANRN